MITQLTTKQPVMGGGTIVRQSSVCDKIAKFIEKNYKSDVRRLTIIQKFAVIKVCLDYELDRKSIEKLLGVSKATLQRYISSMLVMKGVTRQIDIQVERIKKYVKYSATIIYYYY